MAWAPRRKVLILPASIADHISRVAGAPDWLSLWLADLDAGPAPDVEFLSTVDRERAARFRFEPDRRRFLAAHVVLRQLLSREGVNLPADPFEYGTHGKPRLRTSSGRGFNLSHSDNWMLIGMADQDELGVDVEIIRPIPDMHELASRHFTETEQAELTACAAELAVESFLRGWTRKEACLKALGTGLTLEANAVDAGVSSEERLVLVADESWEADVRVVSVDPGPRLIGAVARVEKFRHRGPVLK